MRTGVLIIGAGVTGSGLARDLSLRGIPCLLVDRRDFNAGASGRNHGLLHSGARYVATDPQAAKECRKEGDLLKRLAPQCIEDCGGLFVAVEGDDESYAADFPHMCTKCGIQAEAVDVREALELEPALSPKIIAAYRVADASIDPFKLTIENIADACRHGSSFLPHSLVVRLNVRNRKVETALIKDSLSGREFGVCADMVINASGAWAGSVAALAGIRLEMIYYDCGWKTHHVSLDGRKNGRPHQPSPGRFPSVPHAHRSPARSRGGKVDLTRHGFGPFRRCSRRFHRPGGDTR